jgi:hypothetical protein
MNPGNKLSNVLCGQVANTELVHVLKNTFLSWKKSIEA